MNLGIPERCSLTRRLSSCVFFLTLVVTVCSVHADAQERYALIISGASGGPPYAERYEHWRATLVSSLRSGFRFQDDQLFVLAEKPGPDVGRASREGVRQVIDNLQARMTVDSLLLVVLIGHGTFDGTDAKFNLVGPDLEAREWDRLMDTLPGQLVIVNTTAASFPFLERLAAPGRVVIVATDSSAQRYETRFAEFFSSVFEVDSSDINKDGRVSILEAFVFCSEAVGRWYERQGQLATERPVLEDSGDGIGTEAGGEGMDGLIARRVFLDQPIESQVRAYPEFVELFERRDQLEQQVDNIKTRRSDLTPEDYRRELERLLIDLAKVSSIIRSKTQ